jgi:hypothetical protein
MDNFWHKRIVAILISWVAIAGLFLAWNTTMTTDEGIHTASAYLAIERGDHRFDPEHPFLFKYLTALPLLPLGLHLPPDDQQLWEAAEPSLYDSWKESRLWTEEWFYTSGNDAQLMIFLARLPGVLCLVLLSYLVYICAKRWLSPTAGLWALFFTAFSPTLLAHGPLTNTDVPLALAFLFSVWQLWRYWESPNLKNALWVSLALTITILTKFSGVAILPIALIWLLYVTITKKTGWKTMVVHGCLTLACMWAALWITYFFHSPLDITTIPPSSAYVFGQIQLVLAPYGLTASQLFTWLHYIIPSAYLKGLSLALGVSSLGRETFLLNQHFDLGIWYYFPVLLALKTQLIALFLGAFGVGLSVRSGNIRRWQPYTFLLLLAGVVFGVLAIKSKLNLGIRHISPLLPLFAIGFAAAAVTLQRVYRGIWIPILVCTLYALPVLWQFTNLIGFSNLLVMPGPTAAYRYYDDSNLDWGQHGREIAETMRTHYPGETLYCNYPWSPYALAYYGAHAHAYDPANPPHDGIIVITATQLNEGLSSDSNPHSPLGKYHLFRDISPDYILSNTTFFFRASNLQL